VASSRGLKVLAKRPLGESKQDRGSVSRRPGWRTRGRRKAGQSARRPCRRTGRRRSELRVWRDSRAGRRLVPLLLPSRGVHLGVDHSPPSCARTSGCPGYRLRMSTGTLLPTLPTVSSTGPTNEKSIGG
jgi:hypothetical protein